MEAREEEEEEEGEHTGTGTYRILLERQSQRNETSDMLNLVLSLRATLFGVNGVNGGPPTVSRNDLEF